MSAFPVAWDVPEFPPCLHPHCFLDTVVPFDFAHPSQQRLMWTQPICLRILPTSLLKSGAAACPACPLLADALLRPPHLSDLEKDVQFSTSLFFQSPTPLPRFRHPLIWHKISSPHSWLVFLFFFSPGNGDEKADESALLWIHVHSLFPQRPPRTASVHLLL